MDQITDQEKFSLRKKLLEFQRSGYESYGNYLNEQLEFADKKDNRKAYKSYIEDQIAQNNRRLGDIKKELGE